MRAEITSLFGLDVYTDQGKHVGKINDVVLDSDDRRVTGLAVSDVNPDFILDVCPFCHLQFESGQDWLKKNHSINYDIPVFHLSQITAYCMGMEEKYMGLQYQNNGKEYELSPIEVQIND